MALTWIVETGAIVPGATGYASVAKVQAYSGMRGVDLPDDKNDLIGFMSQAMDYIEAYEARWVGDRVSPFVQTLSWPRVNAYVFRQVVPSTVIPSQLVDAFCYLVGIAANGTDLNAVQDSRAIIKDKIGPLETDYSPNQGATVRPQIPLLESKLMPLLRVGVGTLRSVRI